MKAEIVRPLFELGTDLEVSSLRPWSPDAPQGFPLLLDELNAAGTAQGLLKSLPTCSSHGRWPWPWPLQDTALT